MSQKFSYQLKLSSNALALEQLTRPLLRLLSQVTGMESAYLTIIDSDRGRQYVQYALNEDSMIIPEGLSVPWEDTLCKRALDENRFYSDNVSEYWGDSEAATALGIKTYLSTPIRSKTGKLLGTVCAASSRQIPAKPDVEALLPVLSELLTYALERERLIEELTERNAELANLALTDSLTGLPNHRALQSDLAHLLALAAREHKYALLSVIDLDDFKQVNDTYGHLAGDHLLKTVAENLQNSLRNSDIVGRAGGDEFIVMALGPAAQQSDVDNEVRSACEALQSRLTSATQGPFMLEGSADKIPFPGASVGVVALPPGSTSVTQALELADKEMYRVKHSRTHQLTGST
jgi:diguanylate cyclase